MHIATANLGRGVTIPAYVDNLDRFLDFAGPRAVLFFQEIDEADKPEERDILLTKTRRTHKLFGGSTAVPILVPNHLLDHVTYASRKRACDGLALITPHREVNKVAFELSPDKIEAGVHNLHLPRNVPPVTNSRREQCRKTLRQECNEEPNGVWVADTNTHHGWPTIVPGEVSVIEEGIDRAKAWAQPGYRVKVETLGTVNLRIDGHDGHAARVMWLPR